MKRGFLTLLAAALVSGSAWASGYQVLLQSNRSTAMGNIGVGLRPDPSSINFNPGALAMMRQNGIQVGANLIYSSIAFQPEGSGTTYRTDNPTGTPFHVFAAFGPEESPLKFGLGIYTPFGSTVQWEDGWYGRFSLTSLSLQAIYIQPTISYKLSETFSVGAGLIYSLGGVNLQRDIKEVYMQDDQYAHAELDGSASGWGFNLGAYYQPSDKFSLGINYRSRVNMDVEEGTATFTKSPMVPEEQLPSSASFTASLPLPSTLSLGLAYYPTEKLMVGLDITRTGWEAYESLTFTYDRAVAGSTETTAARNYEASFAYRVGAEYQLSEAFRLRAGGYYDETPVQDGYLTAETPDANTLGLTAGFGVNVGENFVIDASFLYINKEQRDNVARPDAGNISGTYKSVAAIPGVSLTYKF
ncbi:OmpP1/FadL family transporter [Cesiribacter andamanensis]|uniref:Putative outer membrane protein n=1 Tax=Cesiribacter andamanensis AMV16 TaxID=1279009 RepID=M7N155_9BACT|nr:outer membrane protein transport protein [Cesiribacter andamanensis]EMR00946.1 Putative outer membrane protein precursor [Cesiribacter andamanensis AMV16]